ncbi:hypothetical protein [Psychrobacter lutiphocae]|uniref:hypothetical protein n=1 Tax=Psychrobacter lutiphocae TaxID=540500 RepID=UPI0019181BDF|nr:hypothetical protein [Psychrobacter lutiphocae]
MAAAQTAPQYALAYRMNTEAADTVVISINNGQAQEIEVTAQALADGYVEVDAPVTDSTTQITAEAFCWGPCR